MKIISRILTISVLITFLMTGVLVFLFSMQVNDYLEVYPLAEMKQILKMAMEYNNTLYQSNLDREGELENDLEFLESQQEYLWLLDSLQSRLRTRMMITWILTALILVGGEVVLLIFFIRGISRPLYRIFSSLEAYADTRRVQSVSMGRSRKNALVSHYNKLLGDLEMARLQSRAEERFSSRRTGQVMIIHEMKNSLSPLALTLESLEMETEGDVKKGMSEVLEHLMHTEQILNQFRSVTAIEPPVLEVLSVQDVCEGILSAQKSSFPGISFLWEGEDVSLLSDRTYLAIILTNLVRNGAEAIPGEGSVIISCDSSEGMLSVTDTGSGIDASEHVQIFKPGYTTKKTGDGQGLFLVRELCSLLDLEINLSSGPAGTVFTLEFRHG